MALSIFFFLNTIEIQRVKDGGAKKLAETISFRVLEFTVLRFYAFHNALVQRHLIF